MPESGTTFIIICTRYIHIAANIWLTETLNGLLKTAAKNKKNESNLSKLEIILVSKPGQTYSARPPLTTYQACYYVKIPFLCGPQCGTMAHCNYVIISEQPPS